MGGADPEWLAVTVDVWHPKCWVLQTTRETDVRILGNGTNVTDGTATGWYTLCGPSGAAIEGAVAEIRDSSLTDRVEVLAPTGDARDAGQVTRDVAVEFDAGPSIREAFTERGFTHRGRTWYEDGRERRPFLIRGRRSAVRRAIDAVAHGYDADVDTRRLGPAGSPGGADDPIDALSPRQRDAFDLAQRRGYYEYPREITASELAAELGVADATFLEHLRKAESKLLGDAAPR